MRRETRVGHRLRTPLVAVGFLPLAGFAYLLVVSRRREVGAALAMAALDRASRGRFDEARVLLDAVSSKVLSYPYLAKDTFRTRLLALASSARFDEAAAMARERPADLPLSMQEELLCDALRVRAGDVLPEGERERIELDLRVDDATARFLDRAAPTLRSSLGEKLRGVR